MKLLTKVTLIGLSTSLLVASSVKKENLAMEEIVKVGQKSSITLLKTLGSNMKKNMKKGGVMQAYHFCTEKAYSLTQNVNKKMPKGVSVKRISLKYRNPSNAPTKDEAKILNIFENLKNSHIVAPKYLVEKVGKDTYKFYKPLAIKKGVCLKCHGDLSKNKPLQDAIAKVYPHDKAQNHKMDDIRGAVVVTIVK